MSTIDGKRYLVIGGRVKSKPDGDRHFVSAGQLIDLYGVPRKECILTDETDEQRDTIGLDRSQLVVLRPRPDGNYNIGANPMTVDMFEERVRELERQVRLPLTFEYKKEEKRPNRWVMMVLVDNAYEIVPETTRERLADCLESGERRWRNRTPPEGFAPGVR